MSVNKNINIDYTKYQKVPSDSQFELNSNKFMSSNVSHCFLLSLHFYTDNVMFIQFESAYNQSNILAT